MWCCTTVPLLYGYPAVSALPCLTCAEVIGHFLWDSYDTSNCTVCATCTAGLILEQMVHILTIALKRVKSLLPSMTFYCKVNLLVIARLVSLHFVTPPHIYLTVSFKISSQMTTVLHCLETFSCTISLRWICNGKAEVWDTCTAHVTPSQGGGGAAIILRATANQALLSWEWCHLILLICIICSMVNSFFNLSSHIAENTVDA